MLVARRDPPFEAGAHDSAYAHLHLPRHSSRFVSALQIVGTLVGIPVGLASIYSVYHSSFTTEARCETLRANIVGLLDKNADPTTLRMLVGRDVTAFETKCGAVDPDAVKAFKHLLTMQRPPFPPPPPLHPAQAAHEPTNEPVKRTAEAVRPAPAAPKAAVETPNPARAEVKAPEPKPPAPKPAGLKASEAKATPSPASDENWVASVRDALTHAPAHDGAAEAAPAAASVPDAPPRVLGKLPVPGATPVAVTPPTSLAAPVAPALPEPVPVAAAPAPAPAADHPVPPGAIPDAQTGAQASSQTLAKPSEPNSNHSWLTKIPLVNRVVGD